MRLNHTALAGFTALFALTMWSCQQEGSNAALVHDKSHDTLVKATAMPARPSLDTITPKLRNVYEMQIDNLNREKFGSNLDSLGGMGLYPSSIDVQGSYIYIVDRYHDNIKRLDLSTGEWETSGEFARVKDPNIMDLQVSDGTIYVSNMTDSIYVLDKSLTVKSVISLPRKFFRSQQVFLRLPGRPVELYCPPEEKVARVDGDTVVIGAVSSIAGGDIVEGRDFPVTASADSASWYVHLPGRRWLKTEERIPEVDELYARRFALDDKHFVYFDIEPKRVIVHVYEL